jgi:hypothetical protein
MKYVLYAYSYENGWESFFVTKKNMQEKIDSLDSKEYGRYYVVNNKTPKAKISASKPLYSTLSHI